MAVGLLLLVVVEGGRVCVSAGVGRLCGGGADARSGRVATRAQRLTTRTHWTAPARAARAWTVGAVGCVVAGAEMGAGARACMSKFRWRSSRPTPLIGPHECAVACSARVRAHWHTADVDPTTTKRRAIGDAAARRAEGQPLAHMQIVQARARIRACYARPHLGGGLVVVAHGCVLGMRCGPRSGGGMSGACLVAAGAALDGCSSRLRDAAASPRLLPVRARTRAHAYYAPIAPL